MKCEFCGELIYENELGGINTATFVKFHRNCLEKAIMALAKITHEPKINVEDMPDTNWMVICDPSDTNATRPRQYFNSYKQAIAVAKDLTKKSGRTYWVMRHVSTVTIL